MSYGRNPLFSHHLALLDDDGIPLLVGIHDSEVSLIDGPNSIWTKEKSNIVPVPRRHLAVPSYTSFIQVSRGRLKRYRWLTLTEVEAIKTPDTALIPP